MGLFSGLRHLTAADASGDGGLELPGNLPQPAASQGAAHHPAAERGELREDIWRDQARSAHGHARTGALKVPVAPSRLIASSVLFIPILVILIFVFLVAAHWPVLRLPYFWDEAGYYIPAAYDIFTRGDFIPHSTLTNAHPPLVMAYLALAWKLFGYAPAVTHTAILLISALALLG